MRFASRFRSVLFACVLVGLPMAAWADNNTPTAVTQRFQDRLLDVMKVAESLSVRQRYERLLPAVEDAFYLPLMIGTAAGNYWKQATPEERTRLTEAFKKTNISTVATLFDGYSGQAFHIDGERPAPQNTLLVKTRIVDPDGDAVNLDYRLIQIGGRWWIIDVIVDEGISEMSVRRSEYSDILKKQGIAGLTATLTAKADELLSK